MVRLGLGLRVRVRVFADVYYRISYYYYTVQLVGIVLEWIAPVNYNRPSFSVSRQNRDLQNGQEGHVENNVAILMHW